MKNLFLVFIFSFIFFSLSCDEEEDFIDPTEEVVLTIKFSFEYSSTDISLDYVYSELTPSGMGNFGKGVKVTGRPGNFELPMRFSGQFAKEMIGKSASLRTRVDYMVGSQMTSLEKDATIQIHGGKQTFNFAYELVPEK